MVSMHELISSLTALEKQCEELWHSTKAYHQEFMNDYSSLQQVQSALAQLQSHMSNGIPLDKQQIEVLKHEMMRTQQKALLVRENVRIERQKLVQKLNEGVQQIAVMQNDLINVQLLEWKRRQKLSQIGFPFGDKAPEELDAIQGQFELLAEQNWQLRKYATWLLDMLKRSPSDETIIQCEKYLQPIVEHLTRLLIVLVTQSFIVSEQPEPVMKTNHKFKAEVRLLIGDRLGIRQQVDSSNVKVQIIGEEQARQLHAQTLNDCDIDKTAGNISNDVDSLQMDEKGRLTTKFANSKLTRINPRKAKQGGTAEKPAPTATDQKYALLFSISSFQLANLGYFRVWTLSLPIMVTVHGCQDCDAQANILWQRAFGDVDWAPSSQNCLDIAVQMTQLSEVIKYKFSQYTGVRKSLSDEDLRHLAEKLFYPLPYCHDSADSPKHNINFNMFAKPLRFEETELPFSFWDWLFSIMNLITRSKLQELWNEDWLKGFVSKAAASEMLKLTYPEPRFILRFSDSSLGAISIGFVYEDENEGFAPLHLRPFSAKDLEQLSLSQRISTCPQLQGIRYLYPDVEKDRVLQTLDKAERNKSPSPTDQDGYITGEIIMVVPRKGGGGSDSQAPSPASATVTNASMGGQTPFSPIDSPPAAQLHTLQPIDSDVMLPSGAEGGASGGAGGVASGGVRSPEDQAALQHILHGLLDTSGSFDPLDSAVFHHMTLTGGEANMDVEENS